MKTQKAQPGPEVSSATLATNQLQAMQMSFFYFLPSLVLRGILLKGNTFPDGWPDLWPIQAFGVVMMLFGALRYRRTLD